MPPAIGPQYSLHSGRLQMELLAAVRERLGDRAVITGRAVAGFAEHAGGVDVRLVAGRGGASAGSVRTSALVAADGIHSTVRALLHPDEGPPRLAGRMLWRAVTRARPFLGGRPMIMAGHRSQKFVCYPIGHQAADGLQEINWIAELTVPGEAPPPRDGSRRVPATRFREPFAGWRFGWLEPPDLIDGAEVIYEYRGPTATRSTAGAAVR